MNECVSTETTKDTTHAKCGWADLVKSNINRFYSFTQPQVVGPISTEGAAEIPVNTRFLRIYRHFLLKELNPRNRAQENSPRENSEDGLKICNEPKVIQREGKCCHPWSGEMPQRST